MQRACGSSCILIGEVNKQDDAVELKGTLFLPVLISVQSSPGALLPLDEWRCAEEVEEGGEQQ